MKITEFHALASLLDDPDQEVYEQIEGRMTELGEEVVPMLKDIWGNSPEPLVKMRIERIVENIRFVNLYEEFKIWNLSSSPDLLDGLTIFNRFQHPFIDTTPLFKEYESKAREIWLELNDNLTGFEISNVFNRFIFEIWGFNVVTDEFNDNLEYNFVSNMMELKCGNSFIAGCLYLILAEKLELPMRPVMLNEQLIVAYMKPELNGNTRSEQVLFYINPSEKGAIFDHAMISQWVAKQRLENQPSYYLPISNKELLRNYLKRLMSSYQTENQQHKVQLLTQLIG